MENLMKIDGLRTVFRTDRGPAAAVDGLDLEVGRGETVGLVGESGCGKSVTALSILRLIPCPPGRITGGRIIFDGKELLKLGRKEMRKIRGKEISLISQEPLSSLNPVFNCGEQVREAISLHQKVGRRESKRRTVEMFRLVHLPDPEKRYRNYPHQMSGGMRQRVMIAMALSCQPKLLIADEPTTALDVSVQAQIIELLLDLKRKMDMSILLITHDLAVVAQIAERVVVMYAGVSVEEAPVETLFRTPAHPYTRGLIESIPRVDSNPGELSTIGGSVPDPLKLPPGCRYSDRCPRSRDECRQAEPSMMKVGESHYVRCYLYQERQKGPGFKGD